MRNPNERQPAPDYTSAALTMLGVNMMWIFFVIWLAYGLLPVLILAALINRWITRLQDVRN